MGEGVIMIVEYVREINDESTDPEARRSLCVGLKHQLLQAGEISEEEAVSAWYEPQSIEHGVVDLFWQDTCIRVNADGSVERYDVS